MLQSAYFSLPYPAKVLAASARGLQLRKWRYGPETSQLVRQATERESFDPAKWGHWIEARLQSTLTRAAEEIPYYQSVAPGPRRITSLADWPVLNRHDLQNNLSDFIDPKIPSSQLFKWNTSGSTGSPLVLQGDREALVEWYAFSEARWRHWYGVNRGMRWAILGGQQVTAPNRRRPPFWVWSFPLRQLYLSAFHLSPQTVSSYLEAMRMHRVEYLYGYTSALVDLARYASACNQQAPELKVVITNAEALSEGQRDVLGSFFQCPVRETYGMGEMVGGASECEYGEMHWWQDAGYLEILDTASDAPLPAGQVGRMVITGLIKSAMPLIRYDVGDLGSVATRTCQCLRTLPIIDSLDGRVEDAVVTPDGRKVNRFHGIYFGLPIVSGQVVQVCAKNLEVRIILQPGFELSQVQQDLVPRVHDRVGFDMNVQVLQVIDHLRTPRGKIRAVISNLDAGADDGAN